jgi:hypothetical protein
VLALALQGRQQQSDANVLAALEGMGQRQEARASHQVARIGICAGQVKVQLPPQDGQQHHHEQTHHAQRCQGGGAVVQGI